MWQGVLSCWKRPSENTASIKGCTWSATVFKWMICFKVTSTLVRDPGLSSRTLLSVTVSPFSLLASCILLPSLPLVIHSGCAHDENLIRQTRLPSLIFPWSSSDAHRPIASTFGSGQESPWALCTASCDALCVLTSFCHSSSLCYSNSSVGTD